MIIAISGSVGSGKTSFAKFLVEKLNDRVRRGGGFSVEYYDLIHLNEIAIEHKIEDVKELQTFDFDLDALVHGVNKRLANGSKNVVLEGHFAHFLNPEIVDYLIVINRDLKDLSEEYKSRGYNDKKIADNLEVESFNLCLYEGIEEGFDEEKQVVCLNNDCSFEELFERLCKVVEF